MCRAERGVHDRLVSPVALWPRHPYNPAHLTRGSRLNAVRWFWSGDRTIVPERTHRRSAADRFAGSKGRKRTPERCTRQRQADGSSRGRPKARKPVADAGGEKILRRY